MKSFLQKFGMIDFLGIFFPGAVFTLLLQMDYPVLLKPFEAFFGKDQSIVRGFYFVGISYLFGSIFHELSSCIQTKLSVLLGEEEKAPKAERKDGSEGRMKLEKINNNLLSKLICKLIRALKILDLGYPGAVHEKHLGENGDAVKAYKKVFPGESDQKLLNEKDYSEAGRKVYRYVRQKGVGDTAVLLTSIAAMFRSLVFVDLVLILLEMIEGRFLLAIFCILCLPLFFHRWKHFADTGVEYAYLSFLQLKNTDINPTEDNPSS